MSDNRPEYPTSPQNNPGQPGQPYANGMPQQAPVGQNSYGQPSAAGVSAAQPVDSYPNVHQAETVAPGGPELPENIGKGLLFAALGALIGIVAGGLVAITGYLLSLTVLITVFAAVWAYVRGSGGKLEKGLGPLIALLVVGILASWLTAEWVLLRQEIKGTEYEGHAFRMLLELLTMGEAWKAGLWKDFLFFILFGGAGAFAAIRGAKRKEEEPEADPNAEMQTL